MLIPSLNSTENIYNAAGVDEFKNFNIIIQYLIL